MHNSRTILALIGAAAAAVLVAGCTGSGTADSSTSAGSTDSATVAITSTSAPESSVASTTSAPASTAASTATSTTVSTAGTGSTDRAARLDQALAELVAMPGGPPGAIAIVQIGDDRTVHTAGYADVRTKTRPSADDSMRIASVAKALSGATALALVQAGKLKLDDTIGKILPAQPKTFAAVTLRQLLSHTSGVPDFLGPEFAAAYQAHPDTPSTPAELVGFIAKKPLNFKPGTEYRYSNTDNIYVGLMVEAVTGTTYPHALATYVTKPLGLTKTSLPSTLALGTPTLRGYEWVPPAPLKDVTAGLAPGWAWASGGVVSTPADLNTFIRGYVGGKLFGDTIRKAQTDLFLPGGESGPPGPGENSASMALFRYDTSCGTVYGHTGNTVGYTQFIAASPDGSRSVTVSINLQRTDTSEGQAGEVFKGLQRAELAAVCMALDGS